MKNIKLLKWAILTPLSLIGLAAIIFVAANSISNVTLYSTSSSYGGDMMVESLSFSPEYDMGEEVSFRSMEMPSPGQLYDEALAAEIDQKIIKTGTLDVVVDNTEESSYALQEITLKYDGYVSSVSIRELTDGTKSGSVTVRVPVDAFEDALAEMKDVALVVERETVSSQDVTEEYIDIAARLSNAQAQEERYVEILSVADTVEEMLDIEQALWSVRATIESYQGELDYLDNQTGYSTITISLSEEPVITIGGKEFRPGTSVKEAAQALIAVAQWLVIAVIWVVVIGGGIGIPVVVLVWIGYKLYKRIRNKRHS